MKKRGIYLFIQNLFNMKKELDFYAPIKKYFEQQGYDVKAEINDCDCVCVKDDIIVICEFKLHFNISLVFQGMDRQKITDFVYLCIPRYKGRAGYRNFLKAKNLVKRLGLGLIIVNLDSKNTYCEEVVSPICIDIQKNSKKKNNLVKEYNGRTFDLNQGGQTGVKINTAFKETCLKVLCVMEVLGEVSTTELVKNYGFDKNITGILYRNVLKYYIRTEIRAVYKMSDIGYKALNDESNIKLVTFLRENIKNGNAF